MANVFRTLALLAGGAVAGGAAAYAYDKYGKNYGHGPAYQTNDHFENEEAYEEPLEEDEVVEEETNEENVTTF